jgi:hypothetical protein
VSGWVIWQTKFREFVAIVDYETNDQKIIWDHFTERSCKPDQRTLFNYRYVFKERGGFSCTTMPFSRMTGMSSPPQIACLEDRLVVAIPATGEILVYDLDGNLKSTEKIEWGRNYISVEEQREIQQNAIKRYKSIKEPRFASWVSPEENKKPWNQ